MNRNKNAFFNGVRDGIPIALWIFCSMLFHLVLLPDVPD